MYSDEQNKNKFFFTVQQRGFGFKRKQTVWCNSWEKWSINVCFIEEAVPQVSSREMIGFCVAALTHLLERQDRGHPWEPSLKGPTGAYKGFILVLNTGEYRETRGMVPQTIRFKTPAGCHITKNSWIQGEIEIWGQLKYRKLPTGESIQAPPSQSQCSIHRKHAEQQENLFRLIY